MHYRDKLKPLFKCSAHAPVALVAVLALLAGCSAGSPEPPEQEPAYHHIVGAVAIKAQDGYRIEREFAGIVKARQSAELGFELSGKLVAIHVDEGDRVSLGSVLAELDTVLLERKRDELQAQIEEVQAQLALVKLNLQRFESLNQKGYASAQQTDELRTQQQAFEASLDRLAATLAANQTRLEKSRLLAPFDAIINRRYLDLGTVVDPSKPVLRLLENHAMEARIGLPVRLLDTVVAGAEVNLRVGDEPFGGRVIALGSDVNPRTRTVPVRVAFPETARVVDGDLVYVRLAETIAESGFWVPMTSLTEGLRGLWNVYVLEPSEKPDRYHLVARDVQIHHAEAERAFVFGALADDELIVRAGLQRLVPGQVVRREPRRVAR